jgi:UDP-N-acetyl-D-glucosamine dehydrogenase
VADESSRNEAGGTGGPEPAARLLRAIEERSAHVGIVGLGYVGLPLALTFAERGFPVLGFDVDPVKVQRLGAGESYIDHVPASRVAALVDRGGLEATTDFDRLAEADAVLLCVPTPLTPQREPDMSYVLGTVDALTARLRPGQLVVLESTTYPGTTDELLRGRLEASGLVCGQDFFLAFSPEREDPGNPDFTTRSIPKVCGGLTEDCLEVGVALYEQVIDEVVPVSSTRAAEMTKLLENIHRAVNIGLVNEMKIVADRMGIDIHEVIQAASTKPFGFVPYRPGPGLGGHCIPIDPFYLTWKAREYGVYTRFIELAGEVNGLMPRWVVGKVAEGLNGRSKAVNGSRVLVLGVAYKKNIDDPRESPAAELMQLLRELGATVAYSDPHIPVFPKMRKYDFDLQSTPLTPETIASFDCLLIATDHDAFDYEQIREHARLIVDTRGVYPEPASHIVKA